MRIHIAPHLVIAPLHDELLQPDGTPDVGVVLEHLPGQQLQLGVELGDLVLGEQAQQVQAKQLLLK